MNFALGAIVCGITLLSGRVLAEEAKLDRAKALENIAAAIVNRSSVEGRSATTSVIRRPSTRAATTVVLSNTVRFVSARQSS